jgi:glycosyltransferase involved in cell wall biosynthesis
MQKIALVHDNFAQMGGAERVAEELYKLLPGADLHSTLAIPELLSPTLQNARIQTTWMQQLPNLKRYFRHYFLLYPLAVEMMDLSAYDLIVSNCFGYVKGVHKRPGAVHVCYLHAPMRWIWRYNEYSSRAGFSGLTRSVLPPLLAGLKRWDLRATKQPDYLIASSHFVAERIKKAYGRDSAIISPPIDVSRFHLDDKDEDYYLVLSRLLAYKRVDLAVEAATKLNRRLVIIGDGPARAQLEKLAGPSVTFLGWQSDADVARYASRCRALIFPGEEDFGLTPLEVNASGRPVIAYRAGGALETVVDGVTGVFFDNPTCDSLANAIEDFETRSWDRLALRRHAEKFDVSAFASSFLAFLNSVAPSVDLQSAASRNSKEKLSSLKNVVDPSFC